MHHPAVPCHDACCAPPGGPADLLTRARFLRQAGGVGLGLASAGLLAACGNSAAGGTGAATTALSTGDGSAASRTLRVGYLPITDATPLLVAHADGLYEEAGLDVPRPVLLRSWPALAEAFQAGKVDAVHILMPLALQLRFERQFPAKVVAWNHTNGSSLTVRPEIRDVEDLAGGIVAIPGWFSIHNIALQILLREAGLTILKTGEPSKADRSVKLIVMAPPDMPPALAEGAVAGYIVADPFNAAAEVKGIGRVLRFTGDIWRNHACCVVAVREDLLTKRPDVARAFVGSVVQAQAVARNDPAAAANTLTSKKYLPQPDPVVRWALTHGADPAYLRDGAIQHPDWKQPRIDFQGYPFPSYTEELVVRLRETVVDGDLSFLDALEPGRAHRELVDDTLVRAAIDAAGGPAAFGLPASLTRREEVAP
ncbi:MAG: ABC transporter, substrate-binding protein (cluster 10, nitrate/sulfonate/bicarbonate) [uncultured Thermoleophilia bacterium]|uniref:ABC transporter, substrate-binding protein (Cluster 10, nitrate/sulfonate/bicarbonate) n=1 Tax=uncultured Thermoleophilia bacterium TaxID=1497501 RepID=A0A6J4TV26_9ACTN|nr:MAG: ABC transporter, substrate-binding protein (cluster 10, nitrate/sulfonate/bicarbonate) [uncultured Thermoleophilia bacterium]